MPRSKTPTVSLEEAKARFEAWRQNRKGEGRDTGRVVGGSGRGSPEGRRQPNLDGTACGVESSEAADGRDFRRIDEIGPGGIRGTGRAEATAASRMHHRAGMPMRQAANPAEERIGFLPGDAES